LDPQNPSPNEPRRAVDVSHLPSPARRRSSWLKFLGIILGVGFFLIAVPALVGVANRSGLFDTLSQLHVSSELRQSISVVGQTPAGVHLAVDHRDVREIVRILPGTLKPVNVSQGAVNQVVPVASSEHAEVILIVGNTGSRQIKIASDQKPVTVLTDDEKIGELGRANSQDGLHLCDNSNLQWSPDGTTVAFFVCGKDASIIALLEIDTKNLRLVANTVGANARPRSFAWFDGNRILFVEQKSPDVDEAYVINTDGSNKTLVFSGP
jgi:WD40 repeat protein